jgi:hypothetical protein
MVKKDYIVCPLCGWNRVLESAKRSAKGKTFTWPTINLGSCFIIQVREGGGKKAGSGAKGRGKAPGSGFHLIPSESLTLQGARNNPKYTELLDEVKAQLLDTISKALETGWIKKEEIGHGSS